MPAAAPSRMRSRAGRRPRRCFWCFGITRAAREYRAELRAGLTTCGTERPARRQSRDSRDRAASRLGARLLPLSRRRHRARPLARRPITNAIARSATPSGTQVASATSRYAGRFQATGERGPDWGSDARAVEGVLESNLALMQVVERGSDVFSSRNAADDDRVGDVKPCQQGVQLGDDVLA